MEHNKKKLFQCLGLSLLVVFIGLASGMILSATPLGNTLNNSDIAAQTVNTLSRVLMSVFLIFIVKKLYGLKIGFQKENLGKGIFIYGILIVFVTVFQVVSNYQTPDLTLGKAMPIILLYLLFNLAIGLFEEVLCRGVLFNAFRKYYGESRKGIYLATFISSFVFGSLHLINLIGNSGIIVATIAQVIYATLFGVLFCVIYYRSGNLLSCIILHGVFDLTDVFWKCFSNNRMQLIEISNSTDLSFVEAGIIILICSSFLISALVQLRKEFDS